MIIALDVFGDGFFKDEVFDFLILSFWFLVLN